MVKDLIQSCFKDLRHASNLTSRVRLMLGLMWHGIRDEVNLGFLIRIPSGDAAKLKHRLLNCDHPVILDALENGLGKDMAVTLPKHGKIKCRRCNSTISMVPCVACSREGGDGEGGDWDGEAGLLDIPLVPPEDSTGAWPGTPEKIEVMRQRVELGEQPFHANDPRIDKTYTVGTPGTDSVSVFGDDEEDYDP